MYVCAASLKNVCLIRIVSLVDTLLVCNLLMNCFFMQFSGDFVFCCCLTLDMCTRFCHVDFLGFTLLPFSFSYHYYLVISCQLAHILELVWSISYLYVILERCNDRNGVKYEWCSALAEHSIRSSFNTYCQDSDIIDLVHQHNIVHVLSSLFWVRLFTKILNTHAHICLHRGLNRRPLVTVGKVYQLGCYLIF